MVTYGSDNPFPSVLFEEHVDPSNPGAGTQRLFVDTDHVLKLIDSAGTVTTFGGGLSDPMTSRGDVIVRNASNVTARLAKGSAGTYLGSDGTDVAYAAVTDAQLSTSDITTNNASTSKHGFAPKYPNDATKYLDGTGAYTVPAGGGSSGSVWLQRQTASASSTLDFTSFISATYDKYRFEFNAIVPGTASSNFRAQMGTGGGPTYDTGSNYKWLLWFDGLGDSFQATGSSSDTGIDLFHTSSTQANYNSNGTMRLYNPAGATYKHVKMSTQSIVGSGALYMWDGPGAYLSTTAVTAVRFLFSSGTIASGWIDVYGETHA